MRLRSTIAALVALFSAAATHAVADVPAAVGAVTFSGFHQPDGSPISAGCSQTLAGTGSAACNGAVSYSTGTVATGDLVIHVTGAANGVGVVSAGAGGSNPTATTMLNFTGGDDITGAGVASVTTELKYYVTVTPLRALGTAGLRIPLAFADAGFIIGQAGEPSIISARAATFLHAFTGGLIVDGDRNSVFDQVSDSVDAGTLSMSYGGSHSVVFDFTEGDAIAEIDLSASCSYGSSDVGHGNGSCEASADPFFGFDQTAFDAQMGANTFNLSDAFRIEVSSGLVPAGGVPEPASWALMIAGFGLMGAALRHRRRAAYA